MDNILVLAGSINEFLAWRREASEDRALWSIYLDDAEQIDGRDRDITKIVRTGNWWLNPVHNHPMIRMYEYTYWYAHPTLDCGHASSRLIWPDDLGAEPYCPQCTIADQERIIGELAGRLKSFGTILQGEQAQRAVILMQIEEVLKALKPWFPGSQEEWERLTQSIQPYLLPTS